MTDNTNQSSANNVVKITFDVDQNNNIKANVSLPTGSTADQSFMANLWSNFLNGIKNFGVLGNINKIKEIEVYADTATNADLQRGLDQGLSLEDAKKAASTFVMADVMVEKLLFQRYWEQLMKLKDLTFLKL